jgi:hypothetical protein
VPRIIFFGAVIAIGFAIAPRVFRTRDRLPDFPSVVLWSWEHVDDLSFVDPHAAGIAFLAKTVWLNPDRVVARPRLSKLQFSPGTSLMAVVRFESAGRGLPERSAVIREVIQSAQLPGIRALQVDFDARQSERK